VVLHQLGDDLVLAGQLGRELLDPLFEPAALGVARRTPTLEGGRTVLEELLLPAVEGRGVEAVLVADLRDPPSGSPPSAGR